MLSVVTGSAEGIENKGIASRHQASERISTAGKKALELNYLPMDITLQMEPMMPMLNEPA